MLPIVKICLKLVNNCSDLQGGFFFFRSSSDRIFLFCSSIKNSNHPHVGGSDFCFAFTVFCEAAFITNTITSKLSLVFTQISESGIILKFILLSSGQRFFLTAKIIIIFSGGAIGLWTGGSVVMWVHLVYFCVAKGCLPKLKKRGDSESPSDGEDDPL